MIEYCIHSFFIILFTAFLASEIGINKPMFWILMVLLVCIIFTYHMLTTGNDEEDDDEEIKEDKR